MMWNAQSSWFVGRAEDVGRAKGYVKANDGSLRPEQVSAPWRVWDGQGKGWVDAPQLRVQQGTATPGVKRAASPKPKRAVAPEPVKLEPAPLSEAAREKVAVVHPPPLRPSGAVGAAAATNKRGRAEMDALEVRVALAREARLQRVEQRAKELAQGALEQFWKDEIDAAEVDRRKKAAREEAAGEHGALGALDEAYAKLVAAFGAREEAEKACDAAEKARVEAEAAAAAAAAASAAASSSEAEADAMLEAALRCIEEA
eukprot:6132143-Prymnesium_polylepis.2